MRIESAGEDIPFCRAGMRSWTSAPIWPVTQADRLRFARAPSPARQTLGLEWNPATARFAYLIYLLWNSAKWSASSATAGQATKALVPGGAVLAVLVRPTGPAVIHPGRSGSDDRHRARHERTTKPRRENGGSRHRSRSRRDHLLLHPTSLHRRCHPRRRQRLAPAPSGLRHNRFVPGGRWPAAMVAHYIDAYHRQACRSTPTFTGTGMCWRR